MTRATGKCYLGFFQVKVQVNNGGDSFLLLPFKVNIFHGISCLIYHSSPLQIQAYNLL